MSSKFYNKKINSQREDFTLSLKNLSLRYNRLNSNFSDSLYFEFKYALICLGILFVTFANLHKNNIYNYDFKLLVLIAIYFLRRITSKIWYYYNISELLTLKWYKINFYILAFILIFDVKYLLINLFMSNSLFNIFMLFIVALVQIPKLSIFPKKEKRYETIQQEMLYNVKKIIYLSAELVYYSICIPMLFSQKNNVYINSKTLIVYSIIIFIHALLLQFSFFYKKNCANFHVYCKLMGKWRKIVINDSLKHKVINYNYDIYEKNTIVKYHGSYYIAVDDKNASEPNDYLVSILHNFFRNPKVFFINVLTTQSILTSLTLIFVLSSYNNILSLIRIDYMAQFLFYFRL